MKLFGVLKVIVKIPPSLKKQQTGWSWKGKIPSLLDYPGEERWGEEEMHIEDTPPVKSGGERLPSLKAKVGKWDGSTRVAWN